jgi:tRNA pseudouridine38-40 synthase
MQHRLARLLGETPSLVAASRTDAGVHARGQVVAFNTRASLPPERWPRAANSVLPPDIVVLAAEEVKPGFDPRREAKTKVYTYSIYNAPLPDVFQRRYSWHVSFPLSPELMREAAGYLLGTHDFRAFSAAGGSARSTVRTVKWCGVQVDGPVIRIEVAADGFLYKMVRLIVGTLVEVGRGKLAPEKVGEILASGQRGVAGPAAPPHGLCLERVLFT